jgi:hypothetical protein
MDVVNDEPASPGEIAEINILGWTTFVKYRSSHVVESQVSDRWFDWFSEFTKLKEPIMTKNGMCDRIAYVYEGDVYGAKSIVTLVTTDQTARVYAVDVEEEQIYPSLQAVQQRFQALKKQLVSVYGQGFVDNQGEAYTIQTRLGTISLHYERGSLTSSYTIGFTLDDAKAYCMAYDEMDAEDKEYENAPRGIEKGLAQACNHTDLVGLGVKLLQNRQLKAAQTVLRSYDYKVGKVSAKSVPATFVMADYQATVSMVRKKQNITSATITATDEMAAICKDLKTYGFTSSDQKTWRQSNMTVVVSNDKQGRVVVTLR